MTEYWLISAAGEENAENTFHRIKTVTERSEGLIFRFTFPIQELRVGTLDSLVELSDLLNRQDAYVESVVRKLTSYLIEVLENQSGTLEDHLMIGNRTPYKVYLEKFTWEHAKYPTRQGLKDLLDHIVKEIGQIETELKTKSQDYSAVKSGIQSFERQQTGSLITRDLDNVVRKEHFDALGSDYLSTVIVVVPNAILNDWWATYESMIPDKVVPRSSRSIYSDQDHTLVTATLFTNQIEQFKVKCREKKFMVRNYTYDEGQMELSKQTLKELEQKKEKQYRSLFPWLKIQFGEAFAAWLHVKALRLFVESVLRFGLPVNFSSALVFPKLKSQKRLRDMLAKEFDRASDGGKGLSEDIELSRQLGFQTEEFYPYVYYPVKLDFVNPSVVGGLK